MTTEMVWCLGLGGTLLFLLGVAIGAAIVGSSLIDRDSTIREMARQLDNHRGYVAERDRRIATLEGYIGAAKKALG